MTDERLAELAAAAQEHGRLGHSAALELVSEVRRLREALERANAGLTRVLNWSHGDLRPFLGDLVDGRFRPEPGAWSGVKQAEARYTGALEPILEDVAAALSGVDLSQPLAR